LDPRLKLEYMKDHQWEETWINKSKKDVLYIFFNFCIFKFLIYLIIFILI